MIAFAIVSDKFLTSAIVCQLTAHQLYWRISDSICSFHCLFFCYCNLRYRVLRGYFSYIMNDGPAHDWRQHFLWWETWSKLVLFQILRCLAFQGLISWCGVSPLADMDLHPILVFSSGGLCPFIRNQSNTFLRTYYVWYDWFKTLFYWKIEPNNYQF